MVKCPIFRWLSTKITTFITTINCTFFTPVIRIRIHTTGTILFSGITTAYTKTIKFGITAPFTVTILNTVISSIFITDSTFVLSIRTIADIGTIHGFVVSTTITTIINNRGSFAYTSAIYFSRTAPFTITILNTIVSCVFVTNTTIIF